MKKALSFQIKKMLKVVKIVYVFITMFVFFKQSISCKNLTFIHLSFIMFQTGTILLIIDD